MKYLTKSIDNIIIWLNKVESLLSLFLLIAKGFDFKYSNKMTEQILFWLIVLIAFIALLIFFLLYLNRIQTINFIRERYKSKDFEDIYYQNPLSGLGDDLKNDSIYQSYDEYFIHWTLNYKKNKSYNQIKKLLSIIKDEYNLDDK